MTWFRVNGSLYIAYVTTAFVLMLVPDPDANAARQRRR